MRIALAAAVVLLFRVTSLVGEEVPYYDDVPWIAPRPGPLGETEAVRGGTIRLRSRYPARSLLTYGGRSSWLNNTIQGLCFEPLCELNPATLELIPRLATRWQERWDGNRVLLIFDLDRAARWGDDRPFTSADVRATFRYLARTDSNERYLGNLCRKIVRLDTEHGRVTIGLEGVTRRDVSVIKRLRILPAHVLAGKSGVDFRKAWNTVLPVGTGPYVLDSKMRNPSTSIAVVRKKNWWGDQKRRNRGRYNFDRIEFHVLSSASTALSRLRYGTLDFKAITVSAHWREDIPESPQYAKGHLVRQFVSSPAPQSVAAIVANLRHPILKDIRVRKALAMLFEREKTLKKWSGQWTLLSCYFPGFIHNATVRVTVPFDTKAAAKLLDEAGWKIGSDGMRSRDGKRLSLRLIYWYSGMSDTFTGFASTCRDAGVEILVSKKPRDEHRKLTRSRNFDLTYWSWSGSPIPHLRNLYHSESANEKKGDNYAGIMNPEIDRLIGEYERLTGHRERVQVLRKIDRILFDTHPFLLAWTMPGKRYAYRNRFGMPKTVLPRFGGESTVFTYWWIDREKDAALRAGKKMTRPPELVTVPNLNATD